MKQSIFEYDLIDNSFEDRIIDNLDYNRNFSFEKIVEDYKKYFISKRKDLTNSYYRYNKPYITNKEILDRNIFILKNKILFNKSDREIADTCDLCHTTVNTLYKNILKDLKNIIKRKPFFIKD
jgi:hypothetical protein